MRPIVLLAKAMASAMASIPVLAMIYILVYFLIEGVSAISPQAWLIIALVFAAIGVCIGLGYAVWAFCVPIKREIHMLKQGRRLSYFSDTAQFAYERIFEKAQDYMKLRRSSSGRVNILSILLLPSRFFASLSIYTVGSLILSVLILLFAPIPAWVFAQKAKNPAR